MNLIYIPANAILETVDLIIANDGDATFSTYVNDSLVILSQGFTVSNCVIQSISFKNAGNSNCGEYDIRLSIYDCVGDIPTTKISDSVNLVYAGPPQRYMQFDFNNLHLASGKYCFVTSYENVNYISYIPWAQDGFTANRFGVYTGGKTANKVGDGNWRTYDNYALVSFITIIK
jgi:hypothetical protein